MSHYVVLVEADDEAQLSRLMAPYEEGSVFFESKEGGPAKWDWYQVGGRWTGFLFSDYDPKSDPRNWEPCNLCDEDGMRQWEDGKRVCNSCQGAKTRLKWATQWVKVNHDSPMASQVDWDALLKETTSLFLERYDKYHAVNVDEVALGMYKENNGAMSLKQWEDYWKDVFPAYAGYIVHKRRQEGSGLWAMDRTEARLFQLPRDQYIAAIGEPAIFAAFMAKDGRWNERAAMGWWGVPREDADESYDAKFWQFVRGLNPEQRVWVVDCHI